MVDISGYIPETKVEDLIEEGGSSLLIPDGIYKVKIMDSAFKDTKKDAKVKRLCFVMVIVDGQYQNKDFEVGLNIMNANEVARKIAYSDYAKITQACGFSTTPKDTAALHNIAFNVEFKQKKQNDWNDDNGVVHEGSMRSEPVKYIAISGEKKQETTSAPVAGKKPWEK